MSSIDEKVLAKYLCNEADEREIKEVETWMNESSGNRRWVEQMRKSMDFVPKRYVRGMFSADEAWKRVSARISTSAPKIIRMSPLRVWSMAAAVVVLLIVGVFTARWISSSVHETVEWHTADAGLTVYLPDSTEVMLAANSSLRYDGKSFGKKDRRVEMGGKAFFKVRRDTTRQFVVSMRSTNVKVLGTAFQIDNDEHATSVMVEHGKVSFSANGQEGELILTAGMVARYDEATRSLRMRGYGDVNDMSWATGVLKFRSVPLKDVVAKLNAYYGVQLALDDDIADRRLTATFDNMKLIDVLDVINETLGVNLQTKN